MFFVGIDLAWSPKNNSGIAIIEGNARHGRLVQVGIAVSDKEIIRFVSECVGDKNALIAIDAPLVVPNMKGRRVAEALVGDLFRKYNAGAHPANRERLGAWSNGKIRGEVLVHKLERIGFIHDPYVEKARATRKIFEVYPHPSMVVLFGLSRILQYKAKPKRTHAFRVGEFEKYENLLGGLKRKNPSLSIENGVLGKKLGDFGVTELKRHEDMLDAIFCAYIAHYYWVHPENCSILGDMKNGYIMTPVFDSMKGVQSKLYSS